MANRGGLVGRALDRVEEWTGYTVVDHEYLRVQEATAREAYFLAEDLEELGYVSFDHASGRPQEATPSQRRRWAQQARHVFFTDPVGGAAVEMLDEFTFSRGAPRPRAKDKRVQEVIDDFWDDPQNKRVLTTFEAQMRFGKSLSIQSSVFFTMHDGGDDGKVKLSFLNYDRVIGAYTDEEVRQRVLFYLATEPKDEWDFGTRTWKPPVKQPQARYYEAWGAIEEALTERGVDEETAKEFLARYRRAVRKQPDDADEAFPRADKFVNAPGDLRLPHPDEVGEGIVYHVTENLDMEMVFGIPRMRRTIRWMAALNEFMAARVNMMQAAASYIGKKSLKGGTPGAVEKLATRAMRATSDLRATVESAISPEGVKLGPRPASIANEQGGLTFEPFNLRSGAGDAMSDGQMLRGQVSAGERWPQHYFGDASSANLATATAMELPVLKHVEARQELVEGVFHWGIDRQIERAIEVGRLDEKAPSQPEDDLDLARTIDTNPEVEEVLYPELPMPWRINGKEVTRPTQIVRYADGTVGYNLLALVEAHEDKADDERETGLNLDYEFALPSPLRRMMGDLVTAAVGIMQAADPNGENVEFTRTMLTIVLSEAFEIQDAADIVDRIFPKGYVPLTVQAMQAQLQGAQPTDQGAGPPPPGSTQAANFFSPDAVDQPTDPENAYGAPKRSRPPEQAMQEAADDQQPIVLIGRGGQPIIIPARPRARSAFVENGTSARRSALDRDFDRFARDGAMGALARLDMNRLETVGSNGKG